MGKKRAEETATQEEESFNMNGTEGVNVDSDFNLTDDYKPPALVPQGNYNANVVGLSFDNSANCLVWKVTLAENDEDLVCSDGETKIDGQTFYYRNWLPKASDKELMTASGRMTKWQAKINMFADFCKNMNLSVNNAQDVAELVESGEMIGASVLINIKIGEYQGKAKNEIDKMVAN